MPYFTYILYSASLKKYYTGSTGNLENRLNEHDIGKSKYTKIGKPWLLVKYFKFETRSDAVKLENRIKKRGIKRFLNDSG